MTIDGFPLVGPPPEDFETRKLRASAAIVLFGAQAPNVMKIGRFTLCSSLGVGGQGAVFKAHDELLDRTVALKRLTIADPERKARMHREGQALAKVTHVNVVQIYEVGEDETGRPFLVMALVEGQSLGEWLEASRRHWTEVVEVMCAVGDGLAAIHAQGVVHRDVKPENIVIDKDGTPKLVDFGIASVGEAAARSSEEPATYRTIAGTVGYMAPEHYEGLADTRSDQFSLCVTLYEALHGLRPPWSMTRSQAPPLGADVRAKTLGSDAVQGNPSDVAAITHGADSQRRAPVEGLEALPGQLLAVIGRGLRHDSSDRHEDMNALVRALRDTLPRGRRRVWPLLAFIGFVVAGGPAVWAAGGRPEPCDDREPAQLLWRDESKQAVREAFMRAEPAQGQQVFSAVDEMLTRAVTSLDARWNEACDSRGDTSARQLELAVLVSHRVSLTSIIDELGTEGASQLVDVPVRLAEPLARLELVKRRDSCDQAESVLSPTSHIEHIEGLRRRAQAEGIAGHYDVALAIGAKALELAGGESFGPMRARLHLEQGRFALEGLRFEDAIQSLDAARSLAETLGCDRLGAEALAMVAKADLLAPRGSLVRADEASRLALEKLDRIDADGPPLAEALKSRGLYLQHTNEYEQALEHYHRALQIWEAQDPATKSDRLGMADTMLNIGVTQAKQGNHTAAIETLHQAIGLREAALWSSHPSMYKLHASLSYRYLETGALEASRASLSRAIELATMGLGADNPRVAILHMAMARLLDRQHEFEEALRHANEADHILKAKHGERSLERLDALNAIGQICLDAGRYDQAVTALQTSLELLSTSGAEAREALATTRGMLARALSLRGDFDAAEPLFEVALATYEPDPSLHKSPFYPELLLSWGQHVLTRGKHEAAVPPLQRAVETWASLGDNPERLALTRWWLAQAMCPSAIDAARVSARAALDYYRELSTPASRKMSATIEAWLGRPCDERPTAASR